MNGTTQAKRRRVRGRAAIIPFPVKYDEEVETVAFVSWFLADMMPRAEHLHRYVESDSLPIEALLGIERESFEALTLLWAGLPPRKADELVERLAPWWAKFNAMMVANREKAKAMVANRTEEQME